MTYTVYVDDNYNYMNESNRYTLGEFEAYPGRSCCGKKAGGQILAGALQTWNDHRRSLFWLSRVW